MQFVEIALEIDKTHSCLLVFDEPTAVLAESEAEHLIAAMKRLAGTGNCHPLYHPPFDEVMACSNTVSILRDGELIKTLNRRKPVWKRSPN